MLIWVCALHCEAKPIIDRYRLKKIPGDPAYESWAGDDMHCVVSGIGKLAAAAATAWTAARLSERESLAWINLGSAGGDAELGDAFLLDKIVDADSGQCYYPVPATPTGLSGTTCQTLGAPSEDYRADCLFDMEASGFFATAAHFSSAELIQSIKVISDNPRQQTGRNRRAISDLLQTRIDVISNQAHNLLELDREVAGRALPLSSFARLLALAHFSATEENRARRLWRYLANRAHDSDQLLAELGPLGAAGKIIARLEQISRRDAEKL